MKCVKCGREIPDGNMYCGYCAIEEQVSLDGTKQKKIRSYFKLGRFVILIVLLFVFVTVVFYLRKRSYQYNIDAHIDKNGLFCDIPWGTSKEDVRKIFRKKIHINPYESKNGELTIRGRYYDKMKDVNVAITAFFGENKTLESIGVYVFENKDTGYDIGTLKDKYKKKLDEVYGETNTAFAEHTFEWSTINGAVTLKVWDDEEKDNQICIFYSSKYLHYTKGDAKGFFDSISWGTSMDKFTKIVEEDFGVKTEKTMLDDTLEAKIKNYKSLNGIDVKITAVFNDDGLTSVMCQYIINDESDYSYDELRALIKTKYDSILSEPSTTYDNAYIWDTPTGEVNFFFSDKKKDEDAVVTVLYLEMD